MEAIQLNIKGNWGHFRKVQTNNNPLTHDFITKTAFIGLLGAVIGIERKDMRQLYPKFSEGFLYSVAINNATIKQSWAFTLRGIKSHKPSPSQFEILKDPDFDVVLALKDVSLLKYFKTFSEHIKFNKSCYPPVLGLHNCPANLYYKEEGTISSKEGSFTTRGFVSNQHKIETKDVLRQFSSRVGFDKVPTYQNDDFWNLPERFVRVCYPTEGASIEVTGNYFDFKTNELSSQWYMI